MKRGKRDEPSEGEAMMLSNKYIVNVLRAKPGRFIEDIIGDELPMREGGDWYVVALRTAGTIASRPRSNR